MCICHLYEFIEIRPCRRRTYQHCCVRWRFHRCRLAPDWKRYWRFQCERFSWCPHPCTVVETIQRKDDASIRSKFYRTWVYAELSHLKTSTGIENGKNVLIFDYNIRIIYRVFGAGCTGWLYEIEISCMSSVCFEFNFIWPITSGKTFHQHQFVINATCDFVVRTQIRFNSAYLIDIW